MVEDLQEVTILFPLTACGPTRSVQVPGEPGVGWKGRERGQVGHLGWSSTSLVAAVVVAWLLH